MATFASFLSFSSHPSLQIASLRRRSESSVSFYFLKSIQRSDASRSFAIGVSASSDSSSSSSASGFGARGESSRSKKSALFKLVQDIEPLDVSLIQKDVPPTTIDAMKRTISGMLGLLPSDQFQVTVDALWEPLFKLFISSMTTGYTLRNAEYRLSLERNLEWDVETVDQSRSVVSDVETDVTDLNGDRISGNIQPEKLPASDETREANYGIPDFGEMTPEAREYILKLHSSLSSVKKELREVKRKSEALQMQQFVGEEKNDLLDYLRSLEPEKVAELSEPTSPELKATIHSVVHGLLATLSPKMHSKGPDLGENASVGSLNAEAEGDCIDLVENTSLPFQPLISLPRDYLARLLFWCMLLGHYLRSLEYRLELVELLSLSYSAESKVQVEVDEE